MQEIGDCLGLSWFAVMKEGNASPDHHYVTKIFNEITNEMKYIKIMNEIYLFFSVIPKMMHRKKCTHLP